MERSRPGGKRHVRHVHFHYSWFHDWWPNYRCVPRHSLAVTRRHRSGGVLGFFLLIGSAFTLRNFRTPATSDGSASCARNSRFTSFSRSGGRGEISQPRLGPEKGQNRQKMDFPGLGGRSGLDAPRPKLFAC